MAEELTRPRGAGVQRFLGSKAAWVLVLLLFLLLRSIAGWPDGVDRDENQDCWNGRCLAVAGSDFQGRPYPLILTDYGDDKHALYSYFLAGLETLGIRMRPERARIFSMLLVALGCLFMGLAVAIHARSRERGLLAFALSLSLPWLQVGPMLAWELCLCPLGYGLVFLGAVLVAKEAKSLLGGGLFLLGLGIAAYGYPAPKVLAPFLVLGALAFVYRGRKARLILIAAAVLLFLPLGLDHLLHPEHTRRGRELSVFAMDFPDGLACFARTYAAHFSPRFLFLDGDQLPRHFAGFLGVLPLFLIPFLVAPLVSAIRRGRLWPEDQVDRFALLCLLLFPIPAALTSDGLPTMHEGVLGTGHANRTLLGASVFLWIAMRGLPLLRKWPRLSTLCLTLTLLQSIVNLERLRDDWRDAPRTRAAFHERFYRELRERVLPLHPAAVYFSPLPSPETSMFGLIHFAWTAFDSIPVPGRYYESFSIVPGIPKHLETSGKPRVDIYNPLSPPAPSKDGPQIVIGNDGIAPPGFRALLRKTGPSSYQIWIRDAAR